MREIHVHIPAGMADDEVVHIYLDEREPLQQAASSDDTIEGMLHRLESSPSASPSLRATVAALQEMGYTLRVPEMHNRTGQREKYVRVMDPAAPSHGVGYIRPGFLIFTGMSDRNVLTALPGALATGTNVRFPIDGRHELDAARQIKR